LPATDTATRFTYSMWFMLCFWFVKRYLDQDRATLVIDLFNLSNDDVSENTYAYFF
jgi:hypothetical protein